MKHLYESIIAKKEIHHIIRGAFKYNGKDMTPAEYCDYHTTITGNRPNHNDAQDAIEKYKSKMESLEESNALKALFALNLINAGLQGAHFAHLLHKNNIEKQDQIHKSEGIKKKNDFVNDKIKKSVDSSISKYLNK